MGPIFNKKVTEKCNLWFRKQCTKALFTKDLVNNCGLKKKKKKGKRKKKKHGHANAQFKHIQRLPKSQLKEIRESIAMNLRRLKP